MEYRVWGTLAHKEDWIDWDCITYGDLENVNSRVEKLRSVWAGHEFEVRYSDGTKLEEVASVEGVLAEDPLQDLDEWSPYVWSKDEWTLDIYGGEGGMQSYPFVLEGEEEAVGLAKKILDSTPVVLKVVLGLTCEIERRQGGTKGLHQGSEDLFRHTETDESDPEEYRARSEVLREERTGSVLPTNPPVSPQKMSWTNPPLDPEKWAEAHRGHEDAVGSQWYSQSGDRYTPIRNPIPSPLPTVPMRVTVDNEDGSSSSVTVEANSAMDAMNLFPSEGKIFRKITIEPERKEEEINILEEFYKVKGHCLVLVGTFGLPVSEQVWYVSDAMMSYVRSRYFLDDDINVDKETDKVTLCGVELKAVSGVMERLYTDDIPF